MTDLQAESEVLPVHEGGEVWKGHKGMVQSAIYIYNKLRSENLMSLAFHHDKERCTEQYSVVSTRLCTHYLHSLVW